MEMDPRGEKEAMESPFQKAGIEITPEQEEKIEEQLATARAAGLPIFTLDLISLVHPKQKTLKDLRGIYKSVCRMVEIPASIIERQRQYVTRRAEAGLPEARRHSAIAKEIRRALPRHIRPPRWRA